MKTLLASLSLSVALVVSSCGVANSGASAGTSGPVTMTRVDGHTLYKLCDTETNRLVYFTSTGGVAVANTGSCR